MIRSFADRRTEDLFSRRRPKGWSEALTRVALRKLLVLHAATSLVDLRVPPGNRLEKLVGDRKGQWSIRVNDQFRICFSWVDGAAFDVEMTDYH